MRTAAGEKERRAERVGFYAGGGQQRGTDFLLPVTRLPHPDLQTTVGNAPLSSKHPSQLPTTDCLLSIIPPMGGQPSDAPALSPPSPLQQGGQSSNALLSRLHHHCRRAVNPLPWHSRLHHRRRRMVNPAMPLDSRPHHRHC
ncbi:hypothetical protein ACOMHN_030299 [Nucella lapillus]